MSTTLIPFGEFNWGPEGKLHPITCVNHPTAHYLSKNPWTRSLHFIKAAEGFHPGTECPCPFSDLRVIVTIDQEGNP